jgi:hypothetical protein
VHQVEVRKDHRHAIVRRLNHEVLDASPVMIAQTRALTRLLPRRSGSPPDTLLRGRNGRPPVVSRIAGRALARAGDAEGRDPPAQNVEPRPRQQCRWRDQGGCFSGEAGIIGRWQRTAAFVAVAERSRATCGLSFGRCLRRGCEHVGRAVRGFREDWRSRRHDRGARGESRSGLSRLFTRVSAPTCARG